MSEKSCQAQVCREPFATTDCCPKENDAADAVRRAFARVRYWRIPPHWSTQDWFDEVRAILQAAATSAGFDYDKERAVPLRAHIYMRAVAAARTRYRQEWSYHLHSATESGGSVEPIAMPFGRSDGDESIQYFLGQALNHLPVEDQLLIEQLFWNGTRQGRLAVMLGVSQQEVSRRKVRVLQLLRQALGCRSQVFSQFLTFWWALLDSLDLLPGIDLL